MLLPLASCVCNPVSEDEIHACTSLTRFWRRRFEGRLITYLGLHDGSFVIYSVGCIQSLVEQVLACLHDKDTPKESALQQHKGQCENTSGTNLSGIVRLV